MGRRGVSLVAVLAAVAAVLALAPAAQAASIVFAREGDLFVTATDGSTTRRIADGSPTRPFAAPSVAPDGTIWTIVDGRLVRLAPTGEVLGVIQPQSPFPPVDAVVSPDGSKLAYVAADAAGVPSTWYTRTDGSGGEAEYGVQTGLVGPSWLDANRVLLDRGPAATADNVLVDVVEPGATPPVSWFADPVLRPADGAVNATLLFGAWVTEAGTRLALYDLTTTPPAPRCGFPSTGVADPAWSPDGSTLAWSDSRGIRVAAVPSLAVCSAVQSTAIQGAGSVEPHWSPLDVPPIFPGLTATGRPRVAGLALGARTFPAATGTTLRFRSTALGTASMAVVRLVPGVRKGRGCVPGRPRVRLQRCTARVAAGAAMQAPVGPGSVSLPFVRPDLARGRYELWVVVSDPLGRASAPKRVRFTVR